MNEPRVDHEELPEPSSRSPLRLVVKHWELLIVFVLLLWIFVARQTGALPGRTTRLVDTVLVAVVLAVVMRAAGAGPRTWVFNGAMAVASIVISAFGVATSSVTMQRTASVISAYLLAAAFVFIISLVLRQRHVTPDTLFGAFAAYLAVAIIFGIVYTFIARTNPDAFAPPQSVVDGQTNLYYFSFVTVTSLGYGDISPASDLTRILAPIEAIVGAILLAALVGRIVGLLVSQSAEARSQSQLEALTRAIDRLDPGRADPGGAASGERQKGPDD